MAFSLAKYGVIRHCQRESSVWGARGARIVSLSPGITQTPMGQQEFDQQPMMASLVAPVVHSRAEARDRARIDAASLLSAPPPAGGVWGSYLVGAICGSALELHLALWALAFPLCVLAGLIVLDVLRPLQQPEASISQG
jgi:NAD(P)-dependent dehydrogenase (short-subunit alcohol dehydrogenase family)